MRFTRSLPCVVAVALLATGCATTRVPPPAGAAAPDPETVTQWVAKGRIALSAGGDGGSGSFVWQQRSERTDLTVRGPLGAGGLQVTSDGQVMSIEDGQGQTLDGDAARAALERRLGTDLPLASFRYWILGLPAPKDAGAGPAERSAEPASGFAQDGWVLTYDAYKTVGAWSLPAKLTAVTARARVRLVIDDWQLPTP